MSELTFVATFDHPGGGREDIRAAVDAKEQEAKQALGGNVTRSKGVWIDKNTIQYTWTLAD